MTRGTNSRPSSSKRIEHSLEQGLSAAAGHQISSAAFRNCKLNHLQKENMIAQELNAERMSLSLTTHVTLYCTHTIAETKKLLKSP